MFGKQIITLSSQEFWDLKKAKFGIPQANLFDCFKKCGKRFVDECCVVVLWQNSLSTLQAANSDSGPSQASQSFTAGK